MASLFAERGVSMNRRQIFMAKLMIFSGEEQASLETHSLVSWPAILSFLPTLMPE